jgi:hypothetical protein
MDVKKRPKGGKIAIPFLITTLVALILIGVPALYYYNKITSRNEEIQGTNDSGEYVPKAKDSGNIFFVLDFNDDTLVNTFLVLRTDPSTRTFTLVPFLNSTVVQYNGKTSTIDEFYTSGGIESAKSAIESTFGITLNKYIKLDDISFQKICDIFGGASYNVPSGLRGFNAGEQYLSSEQIQNIITHYAFADEEQRVYYAGGILTAMINQTLGERIAGNIDNNFNSVMNLVSDTDITSIDFTAVRQIIVYVFEDDKYTAQFKNPMGEWADGLYQLSDDEKADVREWLSLHDEEQNEEDLQ